MQNTRRDLAPQRFAIPKNNSGRGTVLSIGHGVSFYCDLQPPNRWPTHDHPAAQIVIALDPVRAEMRWKVGRKSHRTRVTMPHVWCLPSGSPHAARWSDTGAMVVIYLDAEFVRLECENDLTEGVVLPLTPILQRDYLVSRFCQRFHDHCHGRRPVSESMLFAGATLLGATLLHIARGHTQVRKGRRLSEHQIEVVARLIAERFREPISPADLARAVRMNEDYFGKVFRNTLNETVMKYVWTYRVHRARLLLESGHHKVGQVAAETGFNDQSHLHRHFKRVFNCPPGAVIPKVPTKPRKP